MVNLSVLLLLKFILLADETCCFLAVDFDKEQWMADAAAYRDLLSRNIPASLERSRSGVVDMCGFFQNLFRPAWHNLGSALMTKTIDAPKWFRLFDRFFPNQDTLPRGVGNLIALPLQRNMREKPFGVYRYEVAALCGPMGIPCLGSKSGKSCSRANRSNGPPACGNPAGWSW